MRFYFALRRVRYVSQSEECHSSRRNGGPEFCGRFASFARYCEGIDDSLLGYCLSASVDGSGFDRYGGARRTIILCGRKLVWRM